MSSRVVQVQKRNPSEANGGLRMPSQNFDTPFIDLSAPGVTATMPYLARWFLWRAPIVLSILFAFLLGFLFLRDGRLENTEIVLLVLTSFLFAWECVPAATAFLGLWPTPKLLRKPTHQFLQIAILLPMRGENAGAVIGNAIYLLQSLALTKTHRFRLFVLSDTRDQNLCAAERTIVENADAGIGYFNRTENTDHKSGNIRAWIEREAADYDAMLVLDADSQMTGDCVLQLVDRLARDPSCGVIQTMPQVLRGETLWQWTQFYAAKIYGPALGRGSARWMGNEANYYGHNAIIRTKAFATCAGLPRIRNEDGVGETIMSHDFVEAALIRRAGWGVQFVPEFAGSFEEGPRTLIDFIKRDARWGYGNLQHLQILGARGFHSVSRWHLLHGAITYLNAILWFLVSILWAILGVNNASASAAATVAFAGVVFIILVPKLVGLFLFMSQIPQRILKVKLLRDFLLELIFSTAVTPALMIHRIKTVFRFALGMKCHWPIFSKLQVNFLEILRFHVVELCSGLGLFVGAFLGVLSFAILPVALCLIFSPVFSWWLAKNVEANRLSGVT